MQKVITKNIAEIFSNVNGNTIISMDSETKPVLRGGKKNPLQGRVTKVMRGARVMVFQNKNSNGYENMVQRRLAAEGKDPESFVLGPRAWGTRVEGTPIVEHNGKRYLEVIFLNPGKTEYLLDGQPVDAERVGVEDKPEGEQGGLSNKVFIRTFAEESITRVSVQGETYTA